MHMQYSVDINMRIMQRRSYVGVCVFVCAMDERSNAESR